MMIDSYEYCKNNIELRIISSKVLSDYKVMQNDNLVEMVHGNNPFPEGTREIFLLKLDLWFRFLLSLEKHLIHQHRDYFEIEDLEMTLKLADITYKKYNQTIKENDTFNHNIYPIWSQIHDKVYDFLIKYINKQKGMQTKKAFKKIGETLIKILRITLFELFEIDNLEKKGKPFLCFSNIDFILWDELGFNNLVHRIMILKKHFKIDEIYIKNFCDFKIPGCLLKDLQQYIRIDFYDSF